MFSGFEALHFRFGFALGSARHTHEPLSSELEQISQSRPVSGLGLSHFQYESLEHRFSCSLLAETHRSFQSNV
jgi:hypothetical protein